MSDSIWEAITAFASPRRGHGFLCVGFALACCVAEVQGATSAAKPPPPKEPAGFSAIPERPGLELTNPVIVVSPKVLDFGFVATNRTATNTFVVENMGPGKLVGKASVKPPFRIISGESYSVTRGDAQVVTVTYTPTGAQVDAAVVTFTGGNGAKREAVGKPLRERR